MNSDKIRVWLKSNKYEPVAATHTLAYTLALEAEVDAWRKWRTAFVTHLENVAAHGRDSFDTTLADAVESARARVDEFKPTAGEGEKPNGH